MTIVKEIEFKTERKCTLKPIAITREGYETILWLMVRLLLEENAFISFVETNFWHHFVAAEISRSNKTQGIRMQIKASNH